jgi:hypothetical protein
MTFSKKLAPVIVREDIGSPRPLTNKRSADRDSPGAAVPIVSGMVFRVSTTIPALSNAPLGFDMDLSCDIIVSSSDL